jgi:uroporphyrinogen decarboxylase
MKGQSAMAPLTKRERVFAALSGAEVDRVPVSAWGHDFLREWTAEGLAEATLEAYRRYDWDFIKVNPRASYYVEDWGGRYQPSGRADAPPQTLAVAVNSAAELRSLRPLDPSRGAYGEQLAALRLIRDGLAGEAPFVQTVFSPLAVASRLAGAARSGPTGRPTLGPDLRPGHEPIRRYMEDAPQDLEAGLAVIAQTLAAYTRACLEAGADGIFFASVDWGSRKHASAEQYNRFGRPFDLQVLEAVRGASFNILHVCRDNNMLTDLLDYPVHAFHWATTGAGNPSLADILSRTDKAVMGGVSHDSTMLSDRPEDVEAEALAAIATTGGRRFLLAPGCSIAPQTPEANLRAMIAAARAAP